MADVDVATLPKLPIGGPGGNFIKTPRIHKKRVDSNDNRNIFAARLGRPGWLIVWKSLKKQLLELVFASASAKSENLIKNGN